MHMADAWGRLTGRAGHRDGHRRSRPCQRRRRADDGARARNRRWCCCPAIPRPGSSGAAAFRNCGRRRWRRRWRRRRGPRRRPRRWAPTSQARCGSRASGRPGPVHLSLPSDLLDARWTQTPSPGRQPAAFTAAPVGLAMPAADAVLGVIATAPNGRCMHRRAAARQPERARDLLARHRGGDGRFRPAIMESPRGFNDATLGAFADVDPPRRPHRAARQGARLHAAVRRAAGGRCRRAAGS